MLILVGGRCLIHGEKVRVWLKTSGTACLAGSPGALHAALLQSGTSLYGKPDKRMDHIQTTDARSMPICADLSSSNIKHEASGITHQASRLNPRYARYACIRHFKPKRSQTTPVQQLLGKSAWNLSSGSRGTFTWLSAPSRAGVTPERPQLLLSSGQFNLSGQSKL